MKRSPLKRRRKPQSNEQKAAAVRFRRHVTKEPCLFSSRPGHTCEGPIDAHHLVEKQFLKTHFSTQPDSIKWRLIYAPEIGVPLCRRAHEAVTTHAGYIWLHEVPARCVDFAETWDFRYRLERECPPMGRDEPDEEPETHGRRCHGDEEIRVNPGWPDPQTEESYPCPGCSDCEDPRETAAYAEADLLEDRDWERERGV